MSQQILHIAETESTNMLMKQMLRNSTTPTEFFIITADFQNDGKGQIGNKWESEKDKNLLFSMLLYPKHIPIAEQFIISQLVSVSIIESLKELCKEETENFFVKWPNDIFWKDKKLGGILIENVLRGANIHTTTIGIGININQEVFISDAPNPVSLSQIAGRTYDKRVLLDSIIANIKQYYIENNQTYIRNKYMETLYRNTGFHLYRTDDEEFSAKIINIALDGKLSLETSSGQIRDFYFKEVEFII